MKKEVMILFGIILIIIISSCNLISEKKLLQKEVDQVEEEVEEIFGPGDCLGEECHKYCEENPEECGLWCQENPNECEILCSKYIDCPEVPFSQPPSELPSSIGDVFQIEGPAGCKGPACQQYCQQNPAECQSWCLENPDNYICKLISGEIMIGSTRGFPDETTKPVEPPQTKITFAKSVSFHDNAFTKEDIIKAKELGINMVTIWPARSVKDYEITFYPERVGTFINLAHQNGLQVELRSSIGSEDLTNYEKYKENAIKHVAEYAKFAEKYKVYRIVPFGEIDNDLFDYCGKITEFSKELLAEMRKHYSGQIGVGVVGSWRDCGYNFKGYDYLTFSAYPQRHRGIDKWLTPRLDVNAESNDALNLAFLTNWAREVADRSDISIIHIGETGVINPTDFKRADASSYAEGDKEKEAEYYQRLFERVGDKINGVSIFYNSLSNYFSIYGDPAEEVVKEWYNKLYPEKKQEETKLIVANPIDLSKVIRISKFRSCAGHDYSGLNIKGEKEPISSMKHYIEPFTKLIGSNEVKVFAPFDGKLTEVEISPPGKQIFISANKAPEWNFIFFHIDILPDIQVGTSVKAGQLIGYASPDIQVNFDFALKQFSFKGEIFDSPFMHMQDSILKEYEFSGVTLENIIISKEFRENNPCPIKGTAETGEPSFTGETEKEDFVTLK